MLIGTNAQKLLKTLVELTGEDVDLVATALKKKLRQIKVPGAYRLFIDQTLEGEQIPGPDCPGQTDIRVLRDVQVNDVVGMLDMALRSKVSIMQTNRPLDTVKTQASFLRHTLTAMQPYVSILEPKINTDTSLKCSTALSSRPYSSNIS